MQWHGVIRIGSFQSPHNSNKPQKHFIPHNAKKKNLQKKSICAWHFVKNEDKKKHFRYSPKGPINGKKNPTKPSQ